MTINKKLTFLTLLILLVSCSNKILISDYLRVKENEVLKFRGVFKPGLEKKIVKKQIAIDLNMAPVMRPDFNDSFISYTNIIYKTLLLGKEKIYYVIDLKDTSKLNPDIGTHNFLSASLLYRNDTTFVTNAYRLNQLKKLELNDFKNFIPPTISKRKKITLNFGKETITLYDFKIVDFNLNGELYKKCLFFNIKSEWPEIIYFGEVVIDKKLGVLKWIRTTGRIENRLMK